MSEEKIENSESDSAGNDILAKDFDFRFKTFLSCIKFWDEYFWLGLNICQQNWHILNQNIIRYTIMLDFF